MLALALVLVNLGAAAVASPAHAAGGLVYASAHQAARQPAVKAGAGSVTRCKGGKTSWMYASANKTSWMYAGSGKTSWMYAGTNKTSWMYAGTNKTSWMYAGTNKTPGLSARQAQSAIRSRLCLLTLRLTEMPA